MCETFLERAGIIATFLKSMLRRKHCCYWLLYNILADLLIAGVFKFKLTKPSDNFFSKCYTSSLRTSQWKFHWQLWHTQNAVLGYGKLHISTAPDNNDSEPGCFCISFRFIFTVWAKCEEHNIILLVDTQPNIKELLLCGCNNLLGMMAIMCSWLLWHYNTNWGE